MNKSLGTTAAVFTLMSLPFKAWTDYDAQITRLTLKDPAWKGKGRLRLAVVADFHDGDEIWSGRALARLVRREAVDLICICGDFFEPGRSGQEACDFLDGVCEWRPIYFVSGNHDEGMPAFPVLKEMVSRRFGVHILDNRNIRVRVKDTWVDLFGPKDNDQRFDGTQEAGDGVSKSVQQRHLPHRDRKYSRQRPSEHQSTFCGPVKPDHQNDRKNNWNESNYSVHRQPPHFLLSKISHQFSIPQQENVTSIFRPFLKKLSYGKIVSIT